MSPKLYKQHKSTKPQYLQGFENDFNKNKSEEKNLKNSKKMQTKDFSHIVLSPILPLQLSAKKPKDSRKYPKEIITVGDEFKQVRLGRKLTQIEVAKQLNVNKNFVHELENNKRKLTVFALHKTYIFLEYIPKILKIDTTTLQGKLFTHRIKNNLTYSNLAEQINLDKSTLSKFEKGKNCKVETAEVIKNFLNNS